MAACPSCGSDNAGDARFCATCGASLGQGCPRCGAELPTNARFCPSCGQEIAPAVGGEERKLVTILFADVSGSTELGERLDAERLREVMDSFFAAMRQEIEAEGGTVEKFIGDAVMAAFGVPAAHEDDPARALRAAIRMGERLGSLNEDLGRTHGVRLAMRTGVNTGEVLAVTTPRPGEAMVTGDAVNVAARLEQAAEPGQVVVGERTARAARGFRFSDAGTVELKGKTDPVGAYHLIEEAAEERPRGIPGLRAPLVGRKSELDLLSSLFERMRAERQPHLVTIYGDPGVGKSRLTAEFLSQVEVGGLGVTIVRGRCLPYGEGVTYWPLGEILKGLAGALDTDSPEVVHEKIAKVGRSVLTSATAPDPDRAAAALAYTVGVSIPGFSFSELAPRQVRLEIHGAWRSFFSALAADAPLIVMVEDIHWADPALLDLLEDVTERVEGPVLFLCPSRPELTDQHPEWGGGRRNYSSLFLDPLTAEDSDLLVSLLLAVEDLPGDLRRRILEHAEGNPFFLEEILRQLIDAKAIIRERDRWLATSEVLQVAIPDTIQGVLAARLDLLEPEEKRAVQAAAVVGRVFWTGAVGAVVNGQGPGDGLDDLLERVERRELVLSRLSSSMAGQREYIFKHVLTRDVAYEGLPRRDRADAHERVARWLETAVGDRRTEFAELLAHHFAEAHRGATEAAGTELDRVEELRSKTFEYLLLAAEDARRRFVLRKSQRIAEQGLRVAVHPLERARASEVLGEAYVNDYQGDPAWSNFTAAIDTRVERLPDDGEAIARLVARAIEVPTRWPGSMTDVPAEEEVTRYLELGTRHVGPGDSPTLVRILTNRAFWPFAFQRERPLTDAEFEDAVEAGKEAVAMAHRLSHPALASAALDGMGGAYMARGLGGQSLDIAEQRVQLLPSLEDPWEVGDTHAMAAWTRFHVGRYRASFEIADAGVRLTPPDAPGMVLHCLAWRALARCRLGDWDGFFADLAKSQEFMGDRSDEPPYFAARPFAAAALVHEVHGNRAAADRFLDLIERIDERQGAAKATDRDPWIAWAEARRGEFEKARGRLWRPLQETWKAARPMIMESRCDLLGDKEAWDDVPAFLDEARTYAEESRLMRYRSSPTGWRAAWR
jgi:class 3 adenylate cyclase